MNSEKLNAEKQNGLDIHRKFAGKGIKREGKMIKLPDNHKPGLPGSNDFFSRVSYTPETRFASTFL